MAQTMLEPTHERGTTITRAARRDGMEDHR